MTQKKPISKASGGTAEVGASGLNSSIGQVTEELNPNLVGRQALETWRKMKDNDGLVGAILFAIENLLRQVDWTVDQADAKEDASTFLTECMEDMSQSWGDFIVEALSMLPFGFAFHEIVYKKRSGPQKPDSKVPSSRFSDGKIGWRKMPLRAQETLDKWEFDEEGGVAAFVQRAAPDYTEVPIPMSKGLLFRTTAYKNNPEGRSLLRSAYTAWYYKKNLMRVEGTGIERDLAGFPIFWLPAEYMSDSASVEQRSVVSAFETLGKNIKSDQQEFMIMPLAYDANGNKAYDFTLTNSGGSRAFDTSAIIQRYNQEIAMTMLADFILLGHEKVGSFALSDDKTDLFGVVLGTFLDIIEDVMNRFAVPRLFDLNGMPLEDLPKIKHGDIEKPDLAKLMTFIQGMVTAGVPLFPDEEVEEYLRNAASLPEMSEDTKKRREEEQERKDEMAEEQYKGLQQAAAQQAAGGGNDGSGQQPGQQGQQPPGRPAGPPR